jgi:uncharacterized protein YdaU (DUF1376 family)
MHYYQFNIGDYASHTRYLTPIQDLAYRRLIDLYYLQEKPIPKDNTASLIGLSDYRTDVEHVLNTYFVLSEQGWFNKRVEQEIAEYKGKKKVKSYAGKKSGEARRAKKHKAEEQTLNTCSTDVEQNLEFVELTNNHKPITKEKNRSAEQTIPDGFESFWNVYDKKKGKQNAINQWKRIKPDAQLAVLITRKAQAYASATEVQFRKDPERWLKGRHWEDELTSESPVDEFMAGAI